MLHKIKSVLVTAMCCVLMIFCAVATAAQSISSTENFSALKKDPAALFNKANTCRLKKLLGEKGYDLFSQAMSLVTNEDDGVNFVAISGGARGLFTIFEGYFRMSTTGNLWIAYLFDNQVHYFTTDPETLNQPPKIMQDWSSRFKDAKWIPQLITTEPDNCK